jgi:tetratricopeptide (TPR) repeat protein
MNEDQTNRIEKYLRGEMTGEDRRSFEADMVKNPELKQETIAMSKILKGINIAFNQDLKGALQEKEQTISPVSQKKTLRIGVITSIAAGIALIAVIYLYNFLPGPDLVKLYTEYYEPYPNIMEPVNRSSDYNNTAYFNYESGHYEAALEGFNRILSKNPKHEPTLFYAGISSLEMNKPEIGCIIVI